MATLRYYCLILTEGPVSGRFPIASPDFHLVPVDLPTFDDADVWFGPNVTAFERFWPKAGAALLFHGRRHSAKDAARFFSSAHAELARCVEGMSGFGVDVLRRWPFRLSAANELPDEVLPDDLFALELVDEPLGVWRARSHGLSKLDQPEVSFRFRGRELEDEASRLCAHLAEYALAGAARVHAGQVMSFGFDSLCFQPSGSIEDWELLPARQLIGSYYGGVGALDVLYEELGREQGRPDPSPSQQDHSLIDDLTVVLQRSQAQARVLEATAVVGDSPHHSLIARRCACVRPDTLVARREEPSATKESGWVFTCGASHAPSALAAASLAEVTQGLPEVVPYLALPPGCSVRWEAGELLVDAGAAVEAIGEEEAEGEEAGDTLDEGDELSRRSRL